MASVVLNHVSKTYDNGVEAVRGVDLEIADGELMVLVGPSGSGKSTVLRMIAGLEEITSGEVLIGDRVVNRLHPKDRDVAMVFQDYALYPHMTVSRNLGFSLSLRKVPKDEIRRRVEQVAEMLSIGELLKRKPHVLSGGQQQRVALGRAIVREPAAFLFDEPLSNLDARLRVTTRAEIKALQRRLKTTSIYVTHDQEEAMTLGHRVAVLCEGRLQQVDAPLALYERPANRFVASFIGSPPMNFLNGVLRREKKKILFVENTADGSASSNGLALPKPWHDTLDEVVDRPIVLGVRPQGLSPSPAGNAATLSLEIDVVEPLGDVIDVVGWTPGRERVVARLPARAVLPSSGALQLHLAEDRMYLFEPGEYGRTLAPGRG